MQEFIKLYKKNRHEIDRFLIQTVRNNGEYLKNDVDNLKHFYGIFNSLELLYVTDSDYIQISKNISRHKADKNGQGRNRSYLLRDIHGLELDHSTEQEIKVTDPYVSSATGESCITIIAFCDDGCYFFDFNLSKLLSRFGLVERHPLFNFVSKSFYLLIGMSMMFFSIMSIGYAFYDYLVHLFDDVAYTLESVFKPIIALTLGLAIFDLAKTLLEREVVYKAYSDKKDENRLLSKFLIAIIIALSIEALMVVFKMALHDTSQMLNALYLITGVALIIISLAVFNYVSDKKQEDSDSV